MVCKSALLKYFQLVCLHLLVPLLQARMKVSMLGLRQIMLLADLEGILTKPLE